MQTIIVSPIAAPSGAAVRYHSLASGSVGNAAGNASSIYRTIFPVAGTLKNFRARAGAALAGGTSMAVNVMLNGSASGWDLTLDSSNQTASDDANTITINGSTDDITLRTTPTSSPSISNLLFSCVFEAAANRSVVTSTHGLTTSSTSFFMAPCGAATSTATQDQAKAVMPCAGSFESMTVRMSAAPGSGITVTYTLYVNGSATGLAASVSGAASQTGSGTASASVTAGQYVVIERTVTGGTPANATGCIALEFRPTTDGESPQMAVMTAGWNTAATRYVEVDGVGVVNSTEASTTAMAPVAFVARDLYADVSTAPSPGNYQFTLRDDGAGTSLTTNLSGSNTTATDLSNEPTVAVNSLISLQCAPASSPAATGVTRISFVSFINPSPAVSRNSLALLGVG